MTSKDGRRLRRDLREFNNATARGDTADMGRIARKAEKRMDRQASGGGGGGNNGSFCADQAMTMISLVTVGVMLLRRARRTRGGRA